MIEDRREIENREKKEIQMDRFRRIDCCEYQSIYLFQGNWENLQGRLRTHFSKIRNTGEQLFHTWGSFYFDENAETIDCLCTMNKIACCHALLW